MLVGGSEEKKTIMSPLTAFIVSNKHEDGNQCDTCGNYGAKPEDRRCDKLKIMK